MGVPTTIPTVEEIMRKITPSPPIAKGKVTATTKGWTKTFYYDPLTGNQVKFAESPTVVAIAEVREGLSRVVSAPTITIPEIPPISPTSISVPSVALPAAPTITIPIVSLPTAPTINIPTVTLPPLPPVEVPAPSINANPLYALVGYRFTCGWAVAGLCDALNKLMELWDKAIYVLIDIVNTVNVGFAKARVAILGTLDSLKKFRDNTQTTLNSYRDNIQSSINVALKDVQAKTQDALNAYRDNIQSAVNAGFKDVQVKTQVALNDYRSRIEAGVNATLADSRLKIQDAFNAYRANIQTSVNAGLSQFIPAFYDMMGLPPPTISPEATQRLRAMGDVNGDGIIDQRDIDILKVAYGTRKGDPRYDEACDLNKDGLVNVSDLNIATGNYGKTAVPTAQLISPVQIRNVTVDSFEFYSLGNMTLHYIAIGKR